ncbi:hypothetical protein HDU76_001838 [Blyttiomyces sp. JEL0837]|nr:hypothetical protein HDU76_001838 [Blyttiomyces sp. JEL0837]
MSIDHSSIFNFTSLWDFLPQELKSKIIHLTDPLTRYLNQDLTPLEITNLGIEIWKQVFIQEWNYGDLDIFLPIIARFPDISNGLYLVNTRSMYQRLLRVRGGESASTVDMVGLFMKELDFNHRICGKIKFDSALVHVAMRHCWLDEVYHVIANDQMNNGLIVIASHYGHEMFLESLLEKQGKKGESEKGMVRAVEETVSKDVIQMAFVEGVRKGYVRIVNVLLDYGKDVIDFDADKVHYAIGQACENGYIDVIKLLLSIPSPGIDFNFENQYPIRVAASNGHAEVVSALLNTCTIARNVNPAAQDNQAFIVACQNNHLDVVKILSKMETVDVAARDNLALRMATQQGNFQVLKYLLTLPDVDPTVQENTSFIIACGKGHFDIVKLLAVQPGVDPSVQDCLAVRVAAVNGHLEVVEFLVTLGVDLSACNNEALRLSCENGRWEIVRMLKARGCGNPQTGSLNGPWPKHAFDTSTSHAGERISTLSSFYLNVARLTLPSIVTVPFVWPRNMATSSTCNIPFY